MEKRIKRSDEPIWWALFSAGGVCFAVFVPAAILFIALLIPIGLLPIETLGFEHSRSLLFGFGGLIFIGVVICLPLFHAMHRIRHGLHDLKLGNDKANKGVAYGCAILLSILALTGFFLGVM
ncbi:fumarate reductase subunit D [Pistricoccus aurantiacus]|uniref:Fumarate reductase subunit D n=1 Tax=Pistricoccus aurantiacus TaxID=1883414 RepID=A0A5B8SSL7_9GAMM|nr:fumarate reductase subunit FrdD [Pistricoccus aurantiacus]QEA40112.1 fumarate reductase subunit D [Pistricoccus aurantiacus]